jgi:hypothetical protein
MDFATTPKQDLKYASESFSQSIALGIDRLSHYGERLSQLLPDMIAGFKASPQLKGLAHIAPLSGDQKGFARLMEMHSFLEVREIKAFVPEGFQSTFLNLVTELDKSVERATQMQVRVLQPFLTQLAHLTAGGMALKSTDDMSSLHVAMAASREDLYNGYSAMFSKNDNSARRKLGLVVERNGDWTAIMQNTNALVSKMESIQRDRIDLLIKQAEDYLDIIHDKVVKGEFSEVNPEVCKALADAAYEVACELEFISITYFRVLELKGSVQNTMVEVKRVIDNQ